MVIHRPCQTTMKAQLNCAGEFDGACIQRELRSTRQLRRCIIYTYICIYIRSANEAASRTAALTVPWSNKEFQALYSKGDSVGCVKGILLFPMNWR